MRQVLQQLGTGQTILSDIPAPAAPRGGLCITTRCSLISAGTERMLVEFGRASMLSKVKQQPQKVRQVLNKVRTDGLFTTVEAVRGKLGMALPLGYCNVGVVSSVGAGSAGFAVGDRVVSNGQHAEVVAVPVNLCAAIPDTVSDEHAAFTVLGAIGLQGVRLAKPTLGETFVVIGLGLIGLITVQILRANGCRVLGIDFDSSKTALARRFGASTVDLGKDEDPLAVAAAFTAGRGVDGVLITAATQSNDPVTQAAQMCRKRGRIILVGVAGLQLNRSDFYEKELTFQVSCSYGPGRYDPAYEQGGNDYPFGFVRWTEQRNFEAVLELMHTGALDVEPLITHRFALDDVAKAYDLLAANNEPYLGILIGYPAENVGVEHARRVDLSLQPPTYARAGEAVVAVIGAGNYASRVLVPAFASAGAKLHAVASQGGISAAELGRKHGFAVASTESGALIEDIAVNTVVVATRHDSHARFVCQALDAKKHVFVEKPLAISLAELDAVEASATAASGLLMVGFNRRFAPQIVRMKALLTTVSSPKSFIFTVNAGAIPSDHWTQNPTVGGGRIVGEGCHFIDLMRFLAGSPIIGWTVTPLGDDGGTRDDKVSITLSFADGSFGTILYLANGNAGFPKERIEIFCAGRSLHLENFRKLRGHGWKGFEKLDLWRQDKGQAACAAAFVDAIRTGGSAPIPLDELLEVGRITIAIADAARLDHRSCG